jgi:hypothetical protein
VRIRNKAYLIVFPPVFLVYGMEPTSSPPKPKERVPPSPPAKTPTDKLIQTLIQKGLLSEEGRELSIMIPPTCTLCQVVNGNA